MSMESFIFEQCRELYGLHIISVKELISCDDKNYLVEGKFEESRKQLCSKNGYVLKILNSDDSKVTDFIEGHQCIMEYLYKNGIRTQKQIPTILGPFYSVKKVPSMDDDDHVIRLFEFVPGKMMNDVPFTANILYEAGKFTGKMDSLLKVGTNSVKKPQNSTSSKGMGAYQTSPMLQSSNECQTCGQGFNHHSLHTRDTFWHPNTITKLTDYLHFVPSTDDRNLLRDVITSYKTDIIPLYDKFQKGSTHGDVHGENLLVRCDTTETKSLGMRKPPAVVISAILDFGDSRHWYYVYEIAVLLADVMEQSDTFEPFEAARHILRGYMEEFTLRDLELCSLRMCICARMAFSAIGAYVKRAEDPCNEYGCRVRKGMWEVLRVLWGKSDVEFLRMCRVSIETQANDETCDLNPVAQA